ncbi:MAG: sulfatase-like hydrolase/transferase, partial [Actinomycetes bacterium]
VDNTLFVYLSDNGLQFGEHGLSNKNEPYSGSTEVPMYLRWDGVIPAGTKSTSPVTNADLTATIADAAGVSLFRPDGVSFFSATRPRGVVLEAVSSASHPAYCGYRTRRFMYVEYDKRKGREFFDYRDDPDELVNKVKWNRYTNRVAVLRAEAMSGCSPTPEGCDW